MKELFFLLIIFCLFSCSSKRVDDLSPPKKESRIVALREAYIFGYPLVTMEMTKRVLTNVKSPTSHGLAPVNQLGQRSFFPDPNVRELLNPNLDILYSSGFLDLSDGPQILTLPHSNERYFMVQVMNGWTDIIASLGTRMDLEKERQYFIHGPNWRGIPPKHMKVIASPTNLNWILGRTYVKDKNDLKNALAFMKKYKLSSIRSVRNNTAINPDYVNTTPDVLISKLSGEEYFNILNSLLLRNQSYKEDRPVIEKLAKIGVGAGLIFDVDNFTPEEQKYLSELPQSVAINLVQSEKNDQLVNGWDMNLDPYLGKFQDHYELRARIALTRLGMPLNEDAVFPQAKIDSAGDPLSGQNKYILHFNKGQNPPSRAMWSLTAYGSNQQLASNALNRYKLDDKMDLLYNPDGSLDIYIQNEVPAGSKKHNWLPVPRGLFTVQGRIYWPESRMLTGQWTMPFINKNTELNMAETE